MGCYLQELGLSHQTWARATHTISQLPEFIADASHILILISDGMIDEFIRQHLLKSQKILVHFSGSLTSEYAQMAHPLMSFNQSLYTPEIYRSIWFITETPGRAFTDLLPGLPNHHAAIPKESKALYHSLCVLSSNFTCLLWQKLLTTLEQQWQIPPEAAHPILKQVMNNIINNSNTALTGPLIRNDQKTIKNNLHALEQDPFHAVYQAFVMAYQQQEKT
jgi:predicted short-subunit dehydrogenase-like oxidoreductase (DUF2520 family)